MIVSFGGHQKAILRSFDDFGFSSYDLVSVPTRLRSDAAQSPLVDLSVDQRRVTPMPSPCQLLARRQLDDGDSWLAMSTRTLARLYSGFLIAEDPQRRLDARKAATLMHQVSLVQHILDRDDLRKVLIGDEVGLGKTIEAGLLMRRLIDENPSVRILYLAPARLVRNVVVELREKLDIDARSWVAGPLADARLNSDRVVVASIHKAVFGENFEKVSNSGPWDVLLVDECHHLSDWSQNGGKPNQSFRLVSQLVKAMSPSGRLVLMSGTPHQGNEARFKNILRLLSDDGKNIESASGRVIFRTKDRVRDWRGEPLFPAREIRKATVVQLGDDYNRWCAGIGALYDEADQKGVRARAAGWAKGQALQWAASSVQAGIGFLVRLAIRRLSWNLSNSALSSAIVVLRPYRGGPVNEAIEVLYQRLTRQIGSSALDFDSLDDEEEADDVWRPDDARLASLLEEGVELVRRNAGQAKWDAVCSLIDAAEGEKVVLFAQPVETVTLVASILEERYGQRPAQIIGNQTDEERLAEVSLFQADNGPKFLVSSRAGGEGLNMQKARRLIHLDVPWNPMDLEQRIGRVHRFGSRKTVIVDTVVAAGSREVDMYRVAREKLALISQHMIPEEFETLFSRVMSLVPPKELENVLSDASSLTGLADPAIQRIGQLVSEGYRTWSTFDESYRKQAEQIKAASAGQAEWQDVEVFLQKNCGATVDTPATIASFRSAGNEIVAVDEAIRVLRLGDANYALGDTGGMPAVGADGAPIAQLGLNIEVVRQGLFQHFSPARIVGPAVLNRPPGLSNFGADDGVCVVIFFVRQRLEQDGGTWMEKAIDLRGYALPHRGDPIELSDSERARVVRACHGASRVKDCRDIVFRADLPEVEVSLFRELLRPSDEQISSGIRYAVWPLAAVAFVP